MDVDAGRVDSEEVVFHDVVVAVVVDVEPAVHADREHRGILLGVQRFLGFPYASPSLEEVERVWGAVFSAQLALRVDEVEPRGLVRGEVGEEAAWGERGVEAERALVLCVKRGGDWGRVQRRALTSEDGEISDRSALFETTPMRRGRRASLTL